MPGTGFFPETKFSFPACCATKSAHNQNHTTFFPDRDGFHAPAGRSPSLVFLQGDGHAITIRTSNPTSLYTTKNQNAATTRPAGLPRLCRPGCLQPGRTFSG